MNAIEIHGCDDGVQDRPIADKFKLKVPLHPAFIIWTSPEGLLLRFAPESKSTQAAEGLRLVHFQRGANF